MTILDRTLVIDTTYQCNGGCLYCQWNKANQKNDRRMVELNELLIPEDTFHSLGIKRVVFSGGEPLLRNDLHDIIAYYHGFGGETVLLTNGLMLEKKTVDKIKSAGLYGIALSIDSFRFPLSEITRGTNKKELSRIKQILNFILLKHGDIELGFNTTLSSLNLQAANISELFKLAKEYSLDYIKFQPLFDDGYITSVGKQLSLNKDNIPTLKRIKEIAHNYSNNILTNNTQFWLDLISYIQGKEINAVHCGALDSQVLLIDGELRSCYWKKDFCYGSYKTHLKTDEVERMRMEFKSVVNRCDVKFWCFCNQPIDHKWEVAAK